jgi:hypothetical protein
MNMPTIAPMRTGTTMSSEMPFTLGSSGWGEGPEYSVPGDGEEGNCQGSAVARILRGPHGDPDLMGFGPGRKDQTRKPATEPGNGTR